MRKGLLLFATIFFISIIFYPAKETTSKATGSPGGQTNSPMDGQNCTGCHTGSINTSSYTDTFSYNIMPVVFDPISGQWDGVYTPGVTYTFTYNITDNTSTFPKYGFEVTAETDGVGAQKTGTFFITDAAETQLVGGTAVTHTSGGTSTSTNLKEWTFDWQAPVAGTGDVTMYVASLAANGNNQNSDDHVFSSSYTFQEVAPSLCQLSISNIINISCNGLDDGSIDVQGSGSTGFYHYYLQKFDPSLPPPGWQQIGQNPAPGLYSALPVTFTNLSADSFRIRMVEGLSLSGPAGTCEDTAYFTITEPPQLTLTGNVLPPPPAVGNSITTVVSGGTPIPGIPPSYTYFWSAGLGGIIPPGQQGSPNLNGLVPGNYEVNVTDANGCAVDSVFTISPPLPSWDCINGVCIDPGTGLGTYGSFSDCQTACVLVPSWDCIVGVGCIDPGTGNGLFNDSLVCVQNCLLCSAGDTSTVNVSCFTELDGQIHINNAFGTPPFTYSLDTVLSTSPFYPTQLSTSSTWTTNNTSHTFSSTTLNSSGNYALGKGIYYYTFEDGSGVCDEVTIFVDRDGDPFVVDTLNTLITLVSDTGLLDGSIQVAIITGGGYPNGATPPYNYAWYDTLGNILQNSSSNILDSLGIGMYYVLITDNGPNGCESDSIVFQMSLAPPCNPDSVLTHNVCPGTNEGAAQLNYLAGYITYKFVDSLFIDIPGGDTSFIDSLYSGNYHFIMIADGVNCFENDTMSFEILEPELQQPIDILNNVNGLLCSNDSSQIEVEFDNLDPSSTYTYQIRDVNGDLVPPNPPLSTPVGDTSFQYLVAGDYSIRLFQNGAWCTPNNSSSYPFIVEEYQLEIIDVAVQPELCGVDSGSITITIAPSPTNPPISYFINGDSIVPPNTSLPSQTFSVLAGIYDSIYVKDFLGCKVYDIPVEVEKIISTYLEIETVKETCREDDGIMSIIPSGGIGEYNISLNGILLGIVQELDTLLIDTLSAGTYYISVIDDEGCEKLDTIILDKVASLEILSIDKIKESCCGFDGSIFTHITSDSLSIVEYRISFDNTAIAIDSALDNYPFMNGLNVWPSQSFITDFNNNPTNTQDSANFVNLTRGYYKINISDQFGCKDSVDYVSYQANLSSVKPKLNIDISLASQVDMQISFTNISCYDSVNGAVRVLYPNVCYDYELWKNPIINPILINTDTSSSIDSVIYYNGLYKGVYGVQAISHAQDSGCVVKSDTFEILEPEIISYDSPLSSAVYCTNPGTCDGEVWLPNLPVGGVPDTSSFPGNSVYKYYINRVHSSVNYFSGPILSDSIFSGLCVGEYEVQVIDGNNCMIKDTIDVIDSSLYIDSFLVSAISCHDSSDALIEVYVHGGRGPVYTYVWEDSTATIIDSSLISQTDSLTEGMYYVTVYDSVGCMAVGSSSVLPAPNELVIAKREDYNLPESCLGESYDGSIGLYISGGVKPYIFNWMSANDTTINGTDPASSIYCDTCTFHQGGPPIQFDSVYMLNSLTADTYLLNITDASGCPDTFWLPINPFLVEALNANNPLIINNLSNIDPVCFGASTGEFIVDINPLATWPLTYSINGASCDSLINTQNDSLFENLYADTFCVIITDAYGCTIDTTVIVNEYDSLGIIIDENISVSCYNGNDGSIEVSAFGGAPPYSWLWNNGSTNPLIENLQAGTYTVSVSDAAGCQGPSEDIDIIPPDPLQLLATVIQDAVCHGVSTGIAEVSVSGGTRNYDYLWSPTGGIDSIQNLLPAGINICTVTDENGCQESISVNINEPEELVLEIVDVEDNLCPGDTNGKITVLVTGGTSPYEYWIESSNLPQNMQSTNIFTNLLSDDYTLWIFDAYNCESNHIIDEKLGEPGEIILTPTFTDLSCYQSGDGKLEIVFGDPLTQTYGGQKPYTYTLSKDNIIFTSGTIFNYLDVLELNYLDIGTYSIEVLDHNGCEASFTNSIEEPSEIIADFILSEVLINEGSSVSISNLSSPFSNDFVWNFGDGSQQEYTFEPTHQYINQGTYVVTLIANNTDLSDDCSDTLVSSIEVEGYDVNNVFTPNGDEINDQFNFNDEMLSELYVNIYNRWGNKVYHWDTPQGFWDGRGYNGELLPEGVYLFTMEATGKNGSSYTEKGSITLIR
ncbi:gliding motility-associated C-terminal domain-containing protein [Flavobacteriales bacterium]|nr:gliding motility-associated C-terminal domain-containing protein [Flavobacteriales bacterium]